MAVFYNVRFQPAAVKNLLPEAKRPWTIVVKVPKLCHRLAGRYFEGIRIGPSPQWLVETLAASDIRSINNLVDITNYVTLETGQPLHAFDFDKIEGGQLLARLGKVGEMVETLDGQKILLGAGVVVLADKKNPLDIAGIKGGKKAEIGIGTRNILLTAGNFDSVNIYQTSKAINLRTDASVRFSHRISPELVLTGLQRATELIRELCGGKIGNLIDVYPHKERRRWIKFRMEELNKITGVQWKQSTALGYLKKLGFTIRGNFIEAPKTRNDIEIFEDLAEEIIRIKGYENLPGIPPRLTVRPTDYDEQIRLEESIKKFLAGVGLSEVYNHTFTNKGDIKLENPTSQDLAFLRHSLADGLVKNIDDNFRFFKRVAIFETGKVFAYPHQEIALLGLALGDKKESTFLELKGLAVSLLEALGLTDYLMADESPRRLRLLSSGRVLGYLMYDDHSQGKVSWAEINLTILLKLVREEKEYQPIPKYPSIIRDLSLSVEKDCRINEVMGIIEQAASSHLEDVDLIDSYENDQLGENRRGLTFRLVFLSTERTLTDKEVDEETAKIIKALKEEIDAEIR
jgi:phenylalanyl-tRNA synthetase beta chain